MNPFRIILIALAACASAQAAPGVKYVEAGHQAVGPAWKDAKPNPQIKIKVGTEIYLSTNVYPDSFDGPLTIRPDGTILPKYCKRPVRIAGLNEEQASKVVLDHVCSEGIYNPKSEVHVSVVEAKRFK